jgi:hypothetical protein
LPSAVPVWRDAVDAVRLPWRGAAHSPWHATHSRVGGSATAGWFPETLSRGSLVGRVGGNRRFGRFCRKEK